MKRHTWIHTFKEILKELSVIPLIALFLAIIVLVGYLLPDSILKNLPFEVLGVLGIMVVLGVLYAIAGIVTSISKMKAKKDKAAKDERERSD